MDKVVEFLKQLDLHPVADHYTVAILSIAVLIDLFASVVSSRVWIRYMALTLTILGSIAAGTSYLTGGWEAHRVFQALAPEAKAVLHRHAQLGEAMAITFGILALWRILLQATNAFANSRGIYLIVAVVAVVVLFYVASLGGELVYTYGTGTALMPAAGNGNELRSPEPTPAGALPTVTVPTPMATPGPPPTSAAPPPASPTPSPGAAPTSSGV